MTLFYHETKNKRLHWLALVPAHLAPPTIPIKAPQVGKKEDLYLSILGNMDKETELLTYHAVGATPTGQGIVKADPESTYSYIASFIAQGMKISEP